MPAAIIDQGELKYNQIQHKAGRECGEHEQHHGLKRAFPKLLLRLLEALKEVHNDGRAQQRDALIKDKI